MNSSCDLASSLSTEFRLITTKLTGQVCITPRPTNFNLILQFRITEEDNFIMLVATIGTSIMYNLKYME